MRRPIATLLCVAIAAAFSAAAVARGGAGGGAGGFSHGSPTGPSSSAAMENSNGRFAQDRDTSLGRAQDRMSDEGLSHEKATDARKRRQQRATPRESAKSVDSGKEDDSKKE